MKIKKADESATQRRWGLTDWLLVAASAGLCALAWRLVGEVRRLRDENESDIRTLRDEYARLERERAELHRQLTSVNSRLADLEAAPTPILHSLPAASPSPTMETTPDALSAASMADSVEVKVPRVARRPRNTPNVNGTGASDQPASRKPRTRKPPGAQGDASQNGTAPS